MDSLYRRLNLTCRKARLVADYCDHADEGTLMSGLGDLTGSLMILSDKVDSRMLLTAMGPMLEAMQTGDRGGLKSAIAGRLIPTLNAMEKSEPEEPVSEAELQQWAGEFAPMGSMRVVCMFGYGDGAYYEALRRQIGEDNLYIVFEPETDRLADLKDQLTLNVNYYLQESMVICATPLYDEIFKTEYASFIRAINENRERVMVNKNTLARFKDSASRNVITNLHILEHINYAADLSREVVWPDGVKRRVLPADIPVIIVAAGPSLDKNIEYLRTAKGHALIFAVDTAMKYLMEHDIMPDLGITVEPIKPMANYADERCFLVPHVFDAESNPEIVSKHTARKFLYNTRDFVRYLLESAGKEVPELSPSGGSVATSAYAICYGLRMKTVILIGQDLAYSGESTHAGGVESAGINGDIGTELIDGYYGDKVRTRSDWKGYLRWFESSILTIRDLGIDMTTIDATEGGALIHGTVRMSLAEAIASCCGVDCGGHAASCERKDYDFEKVLGCLPYILDQKEYEGVKKSITASFTELKTVRKRALAATEACRVLIEGEGTQDDEELIRKCRKDCESAGLYSLINNYAVSDIAEEVSRIRLEDEGRSGEFRQQKLAFEAIAGACDYFEGLYERQEQELQA